MLEYVNPTTGGPVYKTMTFFHADAASGERTLPLKQSANLVFSPFEGAGYSLIGDKRIDWERFDTVVVPGGAWWPARQRIRQANRRFYRGQR